MCDFITSQIKKENIDEIRSLKMPPDAIRDVLEVGASTHTHTHTHTYTQTHEQLCTRAPDTEWRALIL